MKLALQKDAKITLFAVAVSISIMLQFVGLYWLITTCNAAFRVPMAMFAIPCAVVDWFLVDILKHSNFKR